jgi:hypothetical protein
MNLSRSLRRASCSPRSSPSPHRLLWRPATARAGTTVATAASSTPPTPRTLCCGSAPTSHASCGRSRSPACPSASRSRGSTSGRPPATSTRLGSNKVVYRLNPRTAIAVPEGPTFDRVPSILSGDNTGFDTPLRTLVFVQICANCGEESVSAGSTGPSSRRTWRRARHGRRSRSSSRTSRAAARRAASRAAPHWGGPGNHLRRRRGGRHRAGARLRRHETVLGGRRAVGPAASGALADATGDAVPYLVMVAICLATLVAAPSRAAPAAA